MSNKFGVNKKDKEGVKEVLSKCMDAFENLEFEDAVRTSTEIILKFIGAKLDDSQMDEIVDKMKEEEANRPNRQLEILFEAIIELWQITIEKLSLMQRNLPYQYIDDMNVKLIGEKRLNS